MKFHNNKRLDSPFSLYDLKQILLMKERISLFEEGRLDLFIIISELTGILNALEAVSASWKDDFQEDINSLEIIYDSSEDGSISRWKGNYKEDICLALARLKYMVVAMIEAYVAQPDLNISENAIQGDGLWLVCPKCSDAWESDSMKAMVICPKCHCAVHNPRIFRGMNSFEIG